MKLLDGTLTALLFITPLVHLLVSPYTKVEESFNLQATHDILVYGLPLLGRSPDKAAARIAASYDHFSFPGAVPRTFTGAVFLAAASQPLVALVGFQHAQLVVRGVLGCANAAALVVFRRFLSRALGTGVARWWTAFTVTQFHVMFYLTRTLPNMYAFALTTLASALALTTAPGPLATTHRKGAIACLTIAAAVFRSEVAILLIATAAYLFLSAQMTLQPLLRSFAIAFTAALAISVPLDSYLWQEALWPELWGFYFNALQGRSSDWGVSAWHYYLTSALPRLLLNPLALPLILLTLFHPVQSRRARQLLIPSAAFVAVYSLQPHKEARFIFYAVPSLTAVAALGADYLTARRTRSLLDRAWHLVLVASLPLTLALSGGMLLLSSLNYPGGDALTSLRRDVIAPAAADLRAASAASMPAVVHVHADVLTCMTGLTLFSQNTHGLPLAFPLAMPGGSDLDAGADTDASQQISPSLAPGQTPLLLIDKTEINITLGKPSFWDRFDYALLEQPALALGTWEVIGVIQGFDGIDILTPNRARDLDQAKDDSTRFGEDNVLGLGATVISIRRFVRGLTGGWWIGPRMATRIRILRNLRTLQTL